MKEIVYKGQKCLMVYEIPEFNRKKERQCTEERVYLSYPFNYTVAKKDLRS